MCVDAHVGTWFSIQKRARIAEGHSADGHAEAAVLLLRAGVPQQHRPPAREAAQGLPHAADALQAQARHQALHVPQVREGLRGAGRLEDAREELRQALVLHLWLRFQAQEVSQGPHQGLRGRSRRLWDRRV